MQTKNYQLTIEETMEKYGLKDRTGLTKRKQRNVCQKLV